MEKINFNQNWEFMKGNDDNRIAKLMGAIAIKESVNLPHDAMIHETCSPDTKNKGQTGFYPGGEYTYIKTIEIPADWQDNTIVLEFEGVFSTAMVYVNDRFAAKNLFGYSNFYVNLDSFLKYGEKNEIKVFAECSELNSRWYSGSGIYRNVNLYRGNRIHIPVDGVRIKTPVVTPEYAIVEIETRLKSFARKTEKVTLNLSILNNGNVVGTDKVTVTMFQEAEETVRESIYIQAPYLWDCEDPNLYECIITIESATEQFDRITETFGIRSISIDPVNGFQLNGKVMKLRGACIHHDNGVIGAATLKDAEDRRCRQLKEAGFNSIRMSHHPMSKGMLEACDKYGVLVMDELSDMWNSHKNTNDFALHFMDCWEQEVERIVAKDYNHPSVIFYSTGNEIPELGTDWGASINRRISNKIHELDDTRYTISAINGLLAVGSRVGEIIQDLMEQTQQANGEASGSEEQSINQEGSNALNAVMGSIFGKDTETFDTHTILTEVIEESSLATDVIGLNYLTGRHELEKELHPNKTVIGTETFPDDIVKLWGIVKRNSHVLGDYTWTGYDYLGEAGTGIFYYDGNQNFNAVFPDRIAYVGDINIIGYRRPLSYFREIVFGLRKEPYIAVERLNRYGQKHSSNAWMAKDTIESWTWPGYEGKPAMVDVYSDAEEVELLLNGKSLGIKAVGEKNKFTATYEITYEPGVLIAVAYENGKETGQFCLETAQEEVKLYAQPDRSVMQANGEELIFVTLMLIDEAGKINLNAEKTVKVSVEGVGTLQGFGSADPQPDKMYDENTWETFDGMLLAVIRATGDPGEIKVEFTADNCEACIVKLKSI